MNKILKYGLSKLEMLGKSEISPGLVEVLPLREIDATQHSPEEIIAIENALKYETNYIYFRKFTDRPSIPQVYIYDFTNINSPNETDLIELHRKLYSSGHVPMFFVFTKYDLRIFNCYERPAKQNKLVYRPLTTIKLAVDIIETFDQRNEQKFDAFSAKSIDNGSFWDSSEYSSSFKFSDSAYERLLFELKQAMKAIVNQQILPKSIARKLMVMSILVKYLEERKDDNGNSVFPKAGDIRTYTSNGKRNKKKFSKNFFDQFSSGAEGFFDVLKKKGACLKLFDHLAKHFNGAIFQLSVEEREELENADLTGFSLFFEGKLVNGVQYVFWRLYSFNDLPVELISNIYEEYLEKKPGVVYTPPFLVNFLLDEAMPLNKTETDFRVLDPACGSGIFLVGAFRRLIYRWRKRNNWQKPDLETLKALLRENIFGIDKDYDAINLTAFSLSLVLCDELTPLQIWDKLQFDNLYEKNLKSKDFFELVLNNEFDLEFDLIIGNPPFESNLTDAASRIESRKQDDRIISILPGEKKEAIIKLPDNQISLLFLEQSIPLTKRGGLTCLIQPSGPLLYNKSSFHFRRYLLEKYHVPQIIDFTHISRVLFTSGRGDVATAAIFIINDESREKGLLHIIPKRTKANKEKIYFELDTYDFHYVPRKLVLYDFSIWKSNFIGGGRSHQIINQISKLSSIGDFLEKKKKEGWAVSEGFTAATKGDKRKLEELYLKRGNSVKDKSLYEKLLIKLTSSDITGKRFIPTKAFNSNGIDNNQIVEALELKYFHSKGDKKVYKAPHLLIKEVAGEKAIPIELRYDDLCFRNDIIGIHSPKSQKEELERFYKCFNLCQDVFLFYLAGSSGRYMVNKATSLLKDDIMHLPNPIEFNDMVSEISSFEKLIISDIQKYLLEFRRNGEKSKIATEDADKANIDDFSNVFCRVLNSIYKDIKPYRYFETPSFNCLPFYFGDQPSIHFNDKNAESAIGKLVQRKSGTSLRLTRVVRIYDNNIIYLIKPKKLRYWLKSVALRDADETFSDLRKQGF